MLQVQPTGLPPSRPAAKAPAPDPAESGFPAIALLAASQLPPPVQPTPDPDTTPELERAALSQRTAGTGPAAEPGPVHPDREGSEATNDLSEPTGGQGNPGALAEPDAAPESVPVEALQALPGPAAGGDVLPAPAPAIPAPPVPLGPGEAAGTGESLNLQTTNPIQAELRPIPPAEIPIPGAGKVPALTESMREVPGGETLRERLPAQIQATEPAQAAEPAQVAARPLPTPAAAGSLESQIPQVLETPRGQAAPDGSALRPPPRIPHMSFSGIELKPGPVRAEPAGAPGATPAGVPEPFRPQPGALPLPVRLQGPSGPTRPVEAEAAERPRPAEARPPTEEAQPQRPATGAAAETAAARPAQGATEAALPRTESLGMQPSTVPSAAPAGPAATVAPRAEVAATWQVPVPPVLQQVESGIRWMLRNASPGAELQLHPEALGRVRIELKVEGGEVHARLWASDPKSIPVLQENKAFLEVSLKEQGLNLGSFDLRQNSQQPHPDFAQGGARGQFWPTEATAPESGQDAPTRPVHRAANPRRIELIA